MYNERFDGRKSDETRPITAKVGIIPNAKGSAMFKIGNTVAMAAVYGPRILYPKFLKSPDKALLRCNYNMMSFSGSGERVRPGSSRRDREISHITEKALEPVLIVDDFPGSVVDVYIELLQTDAGTRCAGICAASMALAHAGFKMRGLVSAISAGVVGGKLVVDLDKQEEDHEEGATDCPVGMIARTGEITLLQMDGFATPDQIKKMVESAKKACEQIEEIQRRALLEAYETK